MPRTKKEIEDPREIIEDLDRISQKLERNLREVEKVPKKRKRRKHHQPKTDSKLGYIVAVMVNLGIWYAINNLIAGNVPFLTNNISQVLPVFNLSLAITIFGNIIFLFYDQGKFKNFIKILINIAGAIFVYRLYSVFPFNFSALSSGTTVDFGLKIALIGSVIGLGVATIVETLPLFLED